jgi:predicted nucleic acid-binding Zn ribbon protein
MIKRRHTSHIKPLGAALDQLIDTLGIRKKLQEQGVLEIWSEAVGEQIAQVTKATRITRGVLFISVKSGAWRQELTMRKKEIISRLNNVVRAEIVRDIKFR